MKTRSLLLVLLSLVLIPISASAWDTRLFALGNPSLNIGEGIPGSYSGLSGNIPTDQYGVGLSFVPDASDIFTLPQVLANADFFPSNSLITDFTGPLVGGNVIGNGGLVLKPQGPMTFALFLFRPGSNTFAIGAPRAAFASLGSFATDSTLANITAPTAPTNIADFFFAYKLGNILIGASAGFSYGLAANTVTNIAGTANSNDSNQSSSWAATGRAGVSAPLGPVAFDSSVIVVAANASATRVTGSAAAAPNLNDNLNATNVAFAVNARASLPLGETLGLAGLANFSMLPQNFTASNAAGSISTSSAGAFIDPLSIWSFGTGAGMTWKATPQVVLSAYLAGIVGSGSWVSVAGGVTPRPTNSTLWVTLKPTLSGEVKPADWVTLRGGVSYSGSYSTTTVNANTGGTSGTNVAWATGIIATAGASIQIMPKVVLETIINLTNFVGAGAGIAVPLIETSLKMDQ